MVTAAAFVKQHPLCCYCGGEVPAVEIDHQPALIIFPDKHRPKGMEFPACENCNRQCAGDEALLAVLCRFAGSRRPNASPDFSRLRDALKTVQLGYPGLLRRMRGRRIWVQEPGIYRRAAAFDLNQPEIDLGLCRLAAKMALANFYNTQNRAASKHCSINTYWTHSQRADTFAQTKELINMLLSYTFLKQGKWKTDNSFFSKYYFEDGHLFSIAIFHQSIALVARLQEPNASPSAWEKWQYVMVPKPGIGIDVIQ